MALRIMTYLSLLYQDILRQGQQPAVEGEVAVLVRQLTKRFGPLDERTSARLNAATLDQLDIWADRILDAPNFQAVFDGH